jgi:hypothetical protein
MKISAVAILLSIALVLAGCGGGPSRGGNINGTWAATLTDLNGSEEFGFTTSIITNSDGTLTVSNFSFTTNSPCFVSGETVTGAFSLTGDFNGHVAGNFSFKVVSGSPSGNTLNLSGLVSGNKITGNWTLSGDPGCTGSGVFSMTNP